MDERNLKNQRKNRKFVCVECGKTFVSCLLTNFHKLRKLIFNFSFHLIINVYIQAFHFDLMFDYRESAFNKYLTITTLCLLNSRKN